MVKFPKWPFDKFVYAKRTLGTQMKATGEVMSIADTFEQALMKAVRGAEISPGHPEPAQVRRGEPRRTCGTSPPTPTDERLFAVYEALTAGRVH